MCGPLPQVGCPWTELLSPGGPCPRRAGQGGSGGGAHSECEQPFQGRIVSRPPSSLPREMHGHSRTRFMEGKTEAIKDLLERLVPLQLGVTKRGCSVPRITLRYLCKSLREIPVSTQMMAYDLSTKRNAELTHATTWMNPESTVLGEEARHKR